MLGGVTDLPPAGLHSGRVLAGQVIVKLALFATYAAFVSVLLPARVAELDPVGKVAALAVISTVAFAVNAIAQPLVGALSDHTRGPLGRRLPWMIAGAVVGGLAIGALGGADSVLLVGLLWGLAQLALHGLEIAMDAYLVDAFAPARRGVASGVTGLALVSGTAAGALLAGSFAARPAIASWALAGAIGMSVLVFAIIVRDRAVAPPRPRRAFLEAVRSAAATFAAHPDFARILVWRIAYSIAYSVVFAYLLYVLTDLVGVSAAAAAPLVALATALGSAAAAVFVLLGGWLSDRTGRRRAFIVAGNAAIIAGDALLLVWPSVPTVIVTAVLFGAGLGLSIACGRALASLVLPDPGTGAATGLGLLSTAANIGQAAAPAIGGLVIGLAGYPAAFVVSIAGAAAGAIAVLLVRTVR
jgi:MFS family permease